MKFISKWHNLTYIVRASQRILTPGFGLQTTPGLRARFRGENRIFDSELSQKQNGWSDEERNQVDDYILAHPDFGHGVYLAPGEVMPEEKQSLVRDVAPVVVRRCMSITTQNGEIVQCSNEAYPGEEFCIDHKPQAIQKGMLGVK